MLSMYCSLPLADRLSLGRKPDSACGTDSSVARTEARCELIWVLFWYACISAHGSVSADAPVAAHAKAPHAARARRPLRPARFVGLATRTSPAPSCTRRKKPHPTHTQPRKFSESKAIV